MLDTHTITDPIAERMATAMIALNANMDGCHEQSLLAEFSRAEIDQYQVEARRLANSMFVRTEASVQPSRAERLRKAIAIVGGLMPDIGGITSSLRTVGFTNPELADLWSELIAGAGDAFIETRGGH